MFTKLRIKNFKVWKDTGDIRLAPITVLFGTNSAGKTSIPQILLLLKQTAESPDRKRVLHFGDRSTAIDLGDYQAVSHNHDLEQSIELSMAWTTPSPLTVKDTLSDTSITSDHLGFRAIISADGSRNPIVRSMEYRLGQGDGPLRCGMKRRSSGAKYDLTVHGYRPVRQVGRKWGLPSPIQFHGFPDEAVAYYQNTGFLSDLNLEMTRLLKRIHYVGPLREYPKRLYQWSGEVPPPTSVTEERARWKPSSPPKAVSSISESDSA